MGKKSPVALVLDTGALIAFERADPRMRALFREALRTQTRLLIPAGVVGQALRDKARQVALGSLVRSSVTEVPPLDLALAEVCGALCGRRGTNDVVDASVAIVAKRTHATIVTSDPDDLSHLDPTLRIERV